VKRGPGKRFQLTPDQRRDAVAIVEGLLARGRYTHEIKEVFRHEWGRGNANLPLSPRAVMRLIKEAKANIRAHLGAPDEELRAESYHTYKHILRKPDASDRDRILAQGAIDKLLGLPRPQRVAVQIDGRDAEEAERLSLERQRVIADPEASELACRLIERLADAEAEKRGGGRPPYGLRELDRPSPRDGNGEGGHE
jgi:hypothetical protein